MNEELKKLIDKEICEMTNDGTELRDIETLGKLVDIHKDLSNEEYWDVKKEALDMRYSRGGYGNYPTEYGNDYGRRSRDSRGRYMAGRNSGGRYRGEDMMDEMQKHFYNYSDGKEEMNMGNYGAETETMKALEYMLQSVVDFIKMLKKDANSDEEMQLIAQYVRELNNNI